MVLGFDDHLGSFHGHVESSLLELENLHHAEEVVAVVLLALLVLVLSLLFNATASYIIESSPASKLRVQVVDLVDPHIVAAPVKDLPRRILDSVYSALLGHINDARLLHLSALGAHKRSFVNLVPQCCLLAVPAELFASISILDDDLLNWVALHWLELRFRITLGLIVIGPRSCLSSLLPLQLLLPLLNVF